MKKIIDFLSLKNLCFRKKMMVIYVVCIIIPFSVLSIFYYSITVNKIEKQNISDLKYSLEKTRDNIENTIDNVIMISDMIYSDENILKLLSSGEESNMLLVANELEERVTSFMVNNIVEDIDIYTKNDVLYRSSVVNINKAHKEEWLKTFEASGVSLMPMNYYNKENASYVLSVVRNLRTNAKSHKADILKVDITSSAIKNALEFSSENYSLCLLDKDNKIISMPKKHESAYSYGEVIDINQKNIFYEELDFPEEYKVMAEYDFDVSKNIFNKETFTFILIISVLFALASVMIFTITNSFVKCLQRLLKVQRK